MHIRHKVKMTAVAILVSATLSGCKTKDQSIAEVQHWVPHSLNGYLSYSPGSWGIQQNGKTLKKVKGHYLTAQGKIYQKNGELLYISKTGIPEQFELGNHYQASKELVKFTIEAVASDPLIGQQWHLDNYGQLAFSRPPELAENWTKYLMGKDGLTQAEAKARVAELNRQVVSVPGEDMNVAQAYAQGVTGEGTIVVVVDSGLEIDHEDLIDNVLPNRSLNFLPDAQDPRDPTMVDKYGDHGTSVAGLIAARGWNGKGGRGVAPDAKLIGMNYLEHQTNAALLMSHGYTGSGIHPDEPVVAFNRSYGMDTVWFSRYNQIKEYVTETLANHLRSGKGFLNIKSAGNSFGRTRNAKELCKHTGANDLGLTCSNAAQQPDHSFNHFLTIGAVNADGTKSSYSTAGANLWVSAPAGEFGRWEPAMVTTDQSTCLSGYAGYLNLERMSEKRFKYGENVADIYPFNSGRYLVNRHCNYANNFNGTSSAAPNTSGVAALVASANPSLNWRDIKHILAATADQLDPNNQPVTVAAKNGNFVAHRGWETNAAGYHFNNFYGFGRVNAGKAVAMAKGYNDQMRLPAVQKTDWYQGILQPEQTLQIPDNSVLGAELVIPVTDDITVETLQLMLDVQNSDFAEKPMVDRYKRLALEKDKQPVPAELQSKTPGNTAGIDLAIEVISPAGTRSVVLSSTQAIVGPPPAPHPTELRFFDGYIMKDAFIGSSKFYGENAKGNWTIRFYDLGGRDIAHETDFHTSYLNNLTESFVSKANLRVVGH